MERLLRRSHATGLRWVALSLVGLSVAAACSDDSSEAGPNPDGKGGEGGENAAGSGATAGTAGTPATGGTAVNMTGGAGAATAGEGGMGGVPAVITVGEQCTTCGATECADTLTSCSASPDCTDWLACVTACDSSDCVAACDAGHVDAVRVYTDVYACLCTSCKADCTDAGACEKKTCVDDNPLPTTDVVPATLAETFGLTARECAVALGLTRGKSIQAIAQERKIAPETVRQQVKSILRKTGAKRQSQLAATLMCLGHMVTAVPPV
jgi:DNA-binding CsgD family transcriptional regulator